MPNVRNPKTTKKKSGRKPQEWTAERKDIARRIARVRDSQEYGSGYALRNAAGRTALDWCAPKGDNDKDWIGVRTPDVPNLLAFARNTGRRVEWLLTGVGEEMEGATWSRADFAQELATRVDQAVRDVVPKVIVIPSGAQRATACPALIADGTRLLQFILAAARQDAERQLIHLERDALWREADSDIRIAPMYAADVEPKVTKPNRHTDALWALRRSIDAEALREGLAGLGLFRLATGLAGGVAFDASVPMPAFSIRVAPVVPYSGADPRPILRGVRRGGGGA